MTKIFGLLLAATISIGGMYSTVSAAPQVNITSSSKGVTRLGRGEASITIKANEGQSLIGKEFCMYRLFHIENSNSGESINYTLNPEYESSLKKVVATRLNKIPTDVTEYEVIDYIQSLNKHQVEGSLTEQTIEGSYSDFRYFIEELRNQFIQDNVSSVSIKVDTVQTDGSFAISGLDYGYYIVDEITNVENTHSAASMCIVQNANPEATVNIKSDYPVVSKKIQEDDNKDVIKNDGWNDIADYEIGQTVPYMYTTNIPNMNGYQTYYMGWEDKMDSALTFRPETMKIEVSNKNHTYQLKPNEFEIANEEGLSFKVKVADMKAIVDREFENRNAEGEMIYDQKVTIRYDATLNDTAANDTGRPGFENDVRLEFSNNPDSDGNGDIGKTPWDTVVCFTYKMNITKLNNHNLKLEGAKFRLFSDEGLTNEVFVKKNDDHYVVINRDSIGGNDHTGGNQPTEAVEMSSNKDGEIVINGLDSGTYYLVETKAPTGYRPIKKPIVVKIDATFTDARNEYIKGEGATDKTLQQLSATADIEDFVAGVNKKTHTDLETSVTDGSVNLAVVNTVGKKLPITGSGMTLIITTTGVALALGAVYYGRKKEQ